MICKITSNPGHSTILRLKPSDMFPRNIKTNQYIVWESQFQDLLIQIYLYHLHIDVMLDW